MSRGRLDWDRYFMRIALQVAERSTCPRAAVGAVLVRDRSILATGYNGSPSGLPHCNDVGCLIYRSKDPEGGEEENCFRTIHAEINAIIQAALHGVSTKDATCYVTHFPCLNCTKSLINAGISRIVYLNSYRVDENAMAFLKGAGVEVVRLEREEIE